MLHSNEANVLHASDLANFSTAQSTPLLDAHHDEANVTLWFIRINKGSFTLTKLTTASTSSYNASMCNFGNLVAYPVFTTDLLRPLELEGNLLYALHCTRRETMHYGLNSRLSCCTVQVSSGYARSIDSSRLFEGHIAHDCTRVRPTLTTRGVMIGMPISCRL